MRGDNFFKKQFNEFLDYMAAKEPGDGLGSERKLCDHLATSRTTARKCIGQAKSLGLLSVDGTVVRRPTAQDIYPEEETTSPTAIVERAFLKWVLQSDSGPGQAINASQLSREFGVSTTTIREFLQSFQHFGLLERQPGGGWIFRGMTVEFAHELSDIREIFELRSVLKFSQLPRNDASWNALLELRTDHEKLLATIDADYNSFSALDERLHRLINSASSNRFVTEFYQVISLIFFYHYQRDKRDERSRNTAAIYQHLAYIDAILSQNEKRITQACNLHLKEARRDLLLSMAR